MFNSRDVVFREIEYYMANATQEGSRKDGIGKDHYRERAEIEVEPTEISSAGRVEDMVNEDGSLEVEDLGDDLEIYQLARDYTN